MGTGGTEGSGMGMKKKVLGYLALILAITAAVLLFIALRG